VKFAPVGYRCHRGNVILAGAAIDDGRDQNIGFTAGDPV
jgi:hypothetical protein